jgi:hypothetical protein
MVDIPGATVGSRLGPLALVIGITGHRDLRAEDCEALEAQVRAVFDELRGRYRDTPLILLSPLAEGADRLAARVALACDVRLIIMTPRASTLRPMGKPFSISKLFPQGFERDAPAEASYERIYARMNAFNQDAVRLESALTRECETSKADVMPVSEIEHFPRPLRFILDWYAIADSLAIHFQSRTLLTLRGLLVLSILAAIFFQLYSHLEKKPWGLALPYLGALGVAYAWYLWAKRRDYENKYLDYRALAEGL